MRYKAISTVLLFIMTLLPLSAFVGQTFAKTDMSSLSVYISTGPFYTVGVVLTDPQGRRSGLPTVPGDILGMPYPLPGILEEIPGSSVHYQAIDDHSSNERQPISLEIDVARPIEGVYTLVVSGTVLTDYDFTISSGSRDRTTKIKHMYFNGVTHQGVTSEFKITYSPTPGVPTTAVRVATFASAQQDVELAFKLDWIKNAGLKNSLLQKLQNAETAHSRGDTKAAKNILNAILNEVKAQTGKGLDPDAATLLEQDAQYLIDHLQ
jgi:hypothetical protein